MRVPKPIGTVKKIRIAKVGNGRYFNGTTGKRGYIKQAGVTPTVTQYQLVA